MWLDSPGEIAAFRGNMGRDSTAEIAGWRARAETVQSGQYSRHGRLGGLG